MPETIVDMEVIMIDGVLERNVIDYNKYRLHCFKSNIPCRLSDSNLEKILKNRYNKISRIKKRFVWLIVKYRYQYFLTFTFDSHYIDKTDRTKRDLIKKTLLSFDNDIKYIVNVDYGKQNEREHYHAIVGTNNSDNLRDFLKLNYPCLTSCDLINTGIDDIKKVSKYINKLSNHCLKDSTKGKRILFNFKGYDVFKPPLNKYYYILDSHNLGLL